MFEVTISKDGVISKITVNAQDYNAVSSMIQNMYGSSKVQIINIVRKG